MTKQLVVSCLVVIVLLSGDRVARAHVNLLANGGLEKDSDGWVSHPHHFSRETLDEVRSYMADLPSHEELLKGEEILAPDGWVLWRRGSDGTWPASLQTERFYQGMTDSIPLQCSRFGEPSAPRGWIWAPRRWSSTIWHRISRRYPSR